MDHPGFWAPAGPFALSEIATYAGAQIPERFASAAGKPVSAVKALDDAGSGDISFFENRKYLAALMETRAAAVFVAPSWLERVPEARGASDFQRPLPLLRQIA